MMRFHESVVRRPLLTEKGTALREGSVGGAGDAPGHDGGSQVLFEVGRHATKIDIRRAVENLWNVEVVRVRTLVVRGKKKRFGRSAGRRPDWKKAIVTLAAGHKIDFFEGV